MRNQGNKAGGIILIAFGAMVFVIFGVVSIVVTRFVENPSMLMPLYIVLPFAFLMGCIPIVLGIMMIVRANRYKSVMLKGRKSTCKIFNIIYGRNGYLMVVSYTGESGREYKQSLYINRSDAERLRADMIIECFISGENCYVDPRNIKETEED